MTSLPRNSGKQLLKTLNKSGFETIRIKGSHHFLRHPDGVSTVVPIHRGEIIGPGLLSQILKDIELSAEEFKKLLG
jgi:predicted RNA binding protein YcfA (HicA-like mRNA interferase family)